MKKKDTMEQLQEELEEIHHQIERLAKQAKKILAQVQKEAKYKQHKTYQEEDIVGHRIIVTIKDKWEGCYGEVTGRRGTTQWWLRMDNNGERIYKKRTSFEIIG